jgi:UDP-N-acetylmuramate: L-alanyl-gamma-D-glutamyl-meso-diaminopimelate ligase
LKIFGGHNLQNLMGAMYLAKSMGIASVDFLKSMESFTGAGKRLQKVVESPEFVMFKDFAHSPSKLKATTKAVKEQYQQRKVVACMELHTFSSLKKEFLPQYEGAMNEADEAVVYFSPDVVKHKKLEPITKEQVQAAFGGIVKVMTETSEILTFIKNQSWKNQVLLMMSSGNFDGIDYDQLGDDIIANL